MGWSNVEMGPGSSLMHITMQNACVLRRRSGADTRLQGHDGMDRFGLAALTTHMHAH